MNTATVLIRTAVFLIALLADASGIVRLPLTGGQPVLFAASAVCFGLRSGVRAGGAWGFAGGLVLALAFADSRAGEMALAGLLAGAVPSALKRLLYWERWVGQVALGALSCVLFEAVRLIASGLADELAGPVPALLPCLVLDAILTGAFCAVLFHLLRKLEGRR